MTNRERHARTLMTLASVGRLDAVLFSSPMQAGTFSPSRRSAERRARRRSP